MAPKYKLTYFHVRGRGEASRLLFAAANVAFVDERVEFKDWPQMKAQMPQGTLPVLSIDGKVRSSQSVSMARHLAREFRLYGKNNSEALLIDEIVDTAVDFMLKFQSAFREQDPEKKKLLFSQIKSEESPKYLGFLENYVSTAGKDGYAVSGALSLADIFIFSTLENTKCTAEDLAKFPKLKANNEKVLGNKNIAKYLKERPETAQ